VREYVYSKTAVERISSSKDLEVVERQKELEEAVI
jgi:hypothetical protein